MTKQRQRILGAAIELYKRGGTHAVTMRKLAESVDLSATALYRHYANRQAILGAIADAGFDMIGERMEAPFEREDPTERVLEVFDRYIAFAQDEPQIFGLMFHVHHKNMRVFPRDYLAGQSRSGNVLIREVRSCIAAGVWRPDSIAAVVLTIWAHAHGLSVLYHAERLEGNAGEFRELARASMRRVIAGLAMP